MTGSVFFNGVDLFSLSAAQLDAFRNATARFCLSVSSVVTGIYGTGKCHDAGADSWRKAGRRRNRVPKIYLVRWDCITGCSIKPGQLSGGEQQRVAIARALVQKPQLLIADEPTGNLDSATSEEIYALLEQLHRDHQLTLVMVTHNRELASRMGSNRADL